MNIQGLLKSLPDHAQENLSLWDLVETSDPDMVEKVGQGSYAFHTADAQSQIKKATEVFGPCGIGWGVKNCQYTPVIVDAQTPFFNLLQFTATFWYQWDDQVGEFEIASDIAFFKYNKKDSKYNPVSDPTKKVRTDALTKGLSWLGFNADIFMGRFDDQKYVEDLKDKKAKAAAAAIEKVKSEVWEFAKSRGVTWDDFKAMLARFNTSWNRFDTSKANLIKDSLRGVHNA